MVKLFKPAENVIQSRASIGAGAATAPGMAQAQAGSTVEAIGTKYFEEAKKADHTIAYSNAMTQATSEYTKQAQERMSQQVDDEGNPNHTNMVSDVAKIGKDVKNRAAALIIDPEVRARFDSEFQRFDTNQQMQAFSSARKQQISFGRASLYKNLEARKESAVKLNPEQMAFYEDQTRKELETALASGLISPLEKEKMEDGFRATVRMESYRNIIDSDPQRALEQLSSRDSGELGLKEKEKDRLVEEAESKIRDQEVAASKAAAKQNEEINKSIEYSILKLEGDIKNGTAGVADVLKMSDRLGKDEHEQRMNVEELVQKIEAQDRKTHNDISTRTEISLDVADGVDLEAKYSTRELNDAYEAKVADLTDPESGEAPSLMNIAQAVRKDRASYKPLMKRFGNIAQFGNKEQILEAVSAHSLMKEDNPQSVSGLDKDDAAFLAAMETRLEVTDTDIEALTSTLREQVYNKKEPEVKERLSQFNKNKDFSLDKIEANITQMFDTNKLGFIDLPGGEPDMAPGMSSIIQDLMRDGYMRTGDKDAAIEYAETQVRISARVTKINDANELMFNPPELVFPDLTSEEIEASLHEDLESVFGSEFDVDSVSISSYAGTRGTTDPKTGKEIVSYVIFQRGEFGEENVVMSPDGQPLIWEVDADSIRAKVGSEEVEARIKRIEEKKAKFTKQRNRDPQQEAVDQLSSVKSL